MAPYSLSLGDQRQPADMSQSQDTNELFSDDEDDLFDELPSLSIAPVPLPDVLPNESSLPQLLARSCGTENFREVTSVHLKVIASQTSLQRLHIYLPHLVELDLSGSYLLSLRPLGYGLERLAVLRVGRCSLSSLDGLFGVSGLQELYAPHNSISELGLLAILPLLRILDLSNNLVSSITQVGFLSMCECLRDLSLSECPVSQLPGYKASVLATLPRLSLLDGVLLAEGGEDVCGEGRNPPPSPHGSDGEDGATALPVLERSDIEDVAVEDSDVRRRPATVCGPRSEKVVRALPQRPATAAATPTPVTPLPPLPEPETLSDTVSILTSGGVVCGNLAAALRGKHRQHKPAWPVVQEAEKEGVKVICRNGLNVTQLYSEETEVDVDRGGGGDNRKPLLEASRNWREAYLSFRKAHREQWQKEEEEEGV